MKRRELEMTITSPDQIQGVQAWVGRMAEKGLAAGPVCVRLGRERRTLDQNAKMWAVLTDIAKQVEWHGQRLCKEDWKDLLTAVYRGQRLVPGVEGGFVALGMRTKNMSKEQMSELIELAHSFGAERGVKWGDLARKVFTDEGLS